MFVYVLVAPKIIRIKWKSTLSYKMFISRLFVSSCHHVLTGLTIILLFLFFCLRIASFWILGPVVFMFGLERNAQRTKRNLLGSMLRWVWNNWFEHIPHFCRNITHISWYVICYVKFITGYHTDSNLLLQAFLTQRGLPQWTPITQVVEMGETPLFKQYFSTWKDPNAQTGMGSQYRTENIASKWVTYHCESACTSHMDCMDIVHFSDFLCLTIKLVKINNKINSILNTCI